MPGWEIEAACREKGLVRICGCDEAGAGPLAGRVYAVAVILPYELEIPGLDDSKKLTKKRREDVYARVCAEAVAWAEAWVEPEEIDRTDILSARIRAMQLAVDALSCKAEFALVDGNRDHGRSAALTVPHLLVPKGDSLSMSIAAASVIAKVRRDAYMMEMAERYPGYGFERHKGYGTAAHYAAIRRLGPCPIHRMTFLKKMH